MRDQYNIHFLPLRVLFGDEAYESGVDMTSEQFYERLSKGDVHPSTSQPTMVDFMELYRKVGADGTPILSIHLSEGLSGTVNVARAAAKELPDLDITVRLLNYPVVETRNHQLRITRNQVPTVYSF